MDVTERLLKERRARLAAERLLDLRKRELLAANEQLSQHARSLAVQVVAQRSGLESALSEAESLKGANTRVSRDLERATAAAMTAQQRLQRVERVGVATGDGLQRRDHLRACDHGVDGQLRHGGVPAAPAQRHHDLVGGRHHRAGAHRDLARRQAGPVGSGRRADQPQGETQTGFHSRPRSSTGTTWRTNRPRRTTLPPVRERSASRTSCTASIVVGTNASAITTISPSS